MAAASAEPLHVPLCVVLQCWDERVDVPAGSKVVVHVNDPVKYPEMKMESWMMQLESETAFLNCSMAAVHVCGRAPLSMMMLLGFRLCDARSISVVPFTLRPFRPVPVGEHRYGVRAMKIASRSDDKGPTVLYFTIKDQNRARFADVPEDLNVHHILTVTPCDDADVLLTLDNFDEVISQSGGILREAMGTLVDITDEGDTIYLATSAPAILAIVLGMVAKCSDLPRRRICMLERSHADGKYKVAMHLGFNASQ